ncbi:MAG: hypothetical protein EOO38_05265 [Cytophagaceae bacterium]|nr:MAG: hypothetical protein EOO38_05265 [Cytophagaceae bacterium]
MIKKQIAVVLVTAFVVSTCLLSDMNATFAERSTSASVQKVSLTQSGTTSPVALSKVAGYWYMGTMTGRDCNLILRANGTMSVQTGGCFHQDDPIELRWKITGNKIIWSNPSLTHLRSSDTVSKLLGTHLFVVQVGENTVLVPQTKEAIIKRKNYHYTECFWKNLLGAKGLELPKEAEEINRRMYPRSRRHLQN